MAGTSTDQALPYPTLSDAPDAPAQFLALLQAIERRLVRVYASSTDRTTRAPAPVEGAVSWLQDVDRFDCYLGGAWRPLSGRVGSVAFATDLPSTAGGAEVVGYSQAVPLVAGRTYRIAIQAIQNQGTANEVGQTLARYATGAVTTASASAGVMTQRRLAAAGSLGRETVTGYTEFVAPTTATYNVAVGVRTSTGTAATTLVGTAVPTIVSVIDAT